MAQAVALSELRSRVRELADMETASAASHFVDDTELNRAINRALRALRNKLIALRGDDYYATSATAATVAGTATTALPPDFMQLLRVNVTDGSNNWHEVPRFELSELAALKQLEGSSGTASMYDYRYRLVGSNIEIRPKPSTANHTLHIHYIPTLTELSADADTFDGIAGWEDWACYTAAIDLLNKEESYEQAAALAAQRGVIEQQIQALAGNRDASRAPRVQDTRRDHLRNFRGRSLRGDWNG